MRASRFAFACALVVFAAIGGTFVRGQQGQGQTPSRFPLSNPIRERGSSVTGAYEGWFQNKDGSVMLLVGYFNRNTKQVLDIPAGPDNRIEPGGPDQGQPTHFLTGRNWGVFTIKLPKDFGKKKLTWTLVSNGQTNVITLHTALEWVIEPYEDAASKNTPPVLKFQADGATFTGPPMGIAASYSTTLPNPLTLTTWAADEGAKVNVPEPPPGGRGRGRGRGAADVPAVPFVPPLSVTWTKFRGPGAVTFEDPTPAIDKAEGGKASTTATFGAPGEYILRVQTNDQTGNGGGGFQCCWSNAHVAVNVKAAAGTK